MPAMLSIGGVEPHRLAVEGLVVRILRDRLVEHRQRGRPVGFGQQLGQGCVGVDGLAADGLADGFDPFVGASVGERAGVFADRRA